MRAHRALSVEFSSSRCCSEVPILFSDRAFVRLRSPLKPLSLVRASRAARAFALQRLHINRTSSRVGLLVAKSSDADGDSVCIEDEFMQCVTQDGAIVVCDDLDAILQVLPEDVRVKLLTHPRRSELLEVVLDLGRRPEARFLGDGGGEFLRCEEITREDLDAAQLSVGDFGGDNRAGIEGTLHRISAIRSRKGAIVGLTCRVGRAVTGHVDMARNLLHLGQSILFLGRTIAERGVMLVGTAHGQMLENIIKNPTLCDLVGGVQTVTLGDEEARARGTQKSVLERKAPSTFPLLIEMRERSHWVAHQTDRSVDTLLHGRKPIVEVRTRDEDFRVVVERRIYDSQLNSKLDADYEANFGTAVLSMVGGFKLPAEESPDNYAWVSKLGFIQDKDAMAERSMSYASKRVAWEEYDEEYGIGSSGLPGKRGSKRGPRGIRPRNV